MGNFLCKKNKKKSRKDYLNEIFDSLDKDGSLTILGDELDLLWNTYKLGYIDRLQKKVDDIKQKDSSYLIETYGQDGKLFRSHFDAVMIDINLDLDETAAFLRIAKTEELAQLRKNIDNQFGFNL
jgi:hypothetical protein